MKERRVFLFEQLVIFSEPLDKKKGFSLPGFLYKHSIKVRDKKRARDMHSDVGLFRGLQPPLVEKLKPVKSKSFFLNILLKLPSNVEKTAFVFTVYIRCCNFTSISFNERKAILFLQTN